MKPSIQGYDVLDRLGEGGMAVVYRAWSHELQDFAVIKLLNPSLEASPMVRQRWGIEAQLGQWLRHRAVARILNAGDTAEGHAYLAMEYVSGQTLAAVIDRLRRQKRRFPPHLAVAISQAVLDALEYVHEARNPETNAPMGVVHRDLKPGNVMITYDGEVKVLDFGVARVDLGQVRTQTGMLTGTPAYMSPEQVMADKRIDRRSDIYAWAAVLHELLRGAPLIADLAERIEQLKAVLTDQPPLVQPVVPELRTAAVDDVLQTALAKEPRDRFQTAGAFWRALHAAAEPELGVGTSGELGRVTRALFPGGLEKEKLLRSQPRSRSAELTALRPAPRYTPPPSESFIEPQSLDERPNDPGPLPPSPLEVHPEVAGYQVIRRLGEGGTGVVFLVRHLSSGVERALKVLRPELSGNPDVRRRFGVEAQLGQAIQHPGVVQVFEVGEDSEQRPYMVMERVMGQDLAEWLRRLERAGRRMPPQAALRISLDVLAVLEYVHRYQGPDGNPLGIVHRDLKPSNVMVSPTGLVKVLDFGIAKAWLGQARTRTGYRSGTEMYMSPEQALARKDLDFRSDIYSWAAVLFELLTGRALVEAPTAEILPLIVGAPPQQLLRPLEPIAPSLVPALAKALDKTPSLRFESAAAFSEALTAAAPDLVGLRAETLGHMWQSEPPDGPASDRPRSPEGASPDLHEAPTGGLPVLPGYVVRKKLDEGGCGELWLATKGEDATWWVIKTLREDLARRPDIARRFEREVRIMAELDHPHVVRVHGARRTPDGRFFTVMALIRGIDFERILYHFRERRERLPPDISLRVVLDVLSGLHAAHELSEDGRPAGVVHRDLSPRNVMIDADGTAKVIDFGLAAAQLGPRRTPTRADVGTPRFWSPEQADGHASVDRRSDVYAVAVILYEALSGEALTPFGELADIRRAVLQHRPPLIHRIVAGLPAALGEVLDRGLAKAAADRWGSAADFRDALLSAWGNRPLRSHSAVAEHFRRAGPEAFRWAAEQPAQATGAPAPLALQAATSAGQPVDLAHDAIPPTRQGTPSAPPRRRTPAVFIAAAAAVVAVVAALTMTAGPRETRRSESSSATPVSTPSAAAEHPRETPAPAPAVIQPNLRDRDPVVAVTPAAPPPVAALRAPPPPPAPAPKPPPPRKARPAPPPPAPRSAQPTPAPRRARAAPAPARKKPEAGASMTAALDKIRREARNKFEAAEMLRRAMAAGEKRGVVGPDAAAGLETCLQRKFMAPRESVIRECGRWLLR